MKATWTSAVICCTLVVVGCGGGAVPTSPTPSITYENVAGNYTGDINGMLPGFLLTGTLTLNLDQSAAALSGGYAVVATLDDGVTKTPGQGSVTLSGTVASGINPSLNFTVRSVPCPTAAPSDWTGSYESGSGLLTLTGVIHLLNPACVRQLSFPVTISMRR
jgi:hypothetical protein